MPEIKTTLQIDTTNTQIQRQVQKRIPFVPRNRTYAHTKDMVKRYSLLETSTSKESKGTD